jgi:hypothetical protein
VKMRSIGAWRGYVPAECRGSIRPEPAQRRVISGQFVVARARNGSDDLTYDEGICFNGPKP